MGAKPASFLPTDISGMQLWLRADKITGLSDGDSVTTWLDESGQSNDVTQATAANKPTWQTNEINGLAVVRFDGTDDHLVQASDILSADYDDWTIIVVYTNVADEFQARTIFSRSRIDAGTSRLQVYLETNGKPGFDVYTPSGGSFLSATVTDDLGDHAVFWARTGTTRHIYVDSGSVEEETSAEAYTGGAPTQTNIGLDVRDANYSPFTGDIAEIGVYDSELTSGNWSDWKTYLNGRFDMGLT